MYNRESKIGKQVLAWALVFALTLSVIPYSSADGETEEWFEDWYYDFEDRDEDDNSDLITIHVDPDTDSSNEVEVFIEWYVYNNTSCSCWCIQNYAIRHSLHLVNIGFHQHMMQHLNFVHEQLIMLVTLKLKKLVTLQ
jgi:hypothetical protein